MAKGRKEDTKEKNKGEGVRAKERKEDMMVKKKKEGNGNRKERC